MLDLDELDRLHSVGHKSTRDIDLDTARRIVEASRCLVNKVIEHWPQISARLRAAEELANAVARLREVYDRSGDAMNDHLGADVEYDTEHWTRETAAANQAVFDAAKVYRKVVADG